MLDLNHPQTEHIFEASALQDRIRIHLVAAEKEKRKLNEEEKRESLRRLEQLDELNVAHFKADKGITKTLDALRTAITEDHQTEELWRLFINLAETDGPNFGTYAI